MKNILNIKYEKFLLQNGLEVILCPNKSFPNVAVNIWYKVGSANEERGKTGFAHLFEHMMFQGSQNVAKEMHFKYIQEAGGSLNGSTSMDRTNYYETVPPDALEIALWLESDRMGFLLPALTEEKLENQKDVVLNERRQNYDNQPYGLAWEILFENLFPDNHPYHWPTIGYENDIKKFNVTDVKKFFKTYYSPKNSSLVLAGNFEKENARDLIHKYFSSIPNNSEIPPIYAEEISLIESKKIVHQDNVQLKRLYFAWLSDKAYGEDDSAMDILADILAGSKNTRLYKKLVHETETAQDVNAFQYSGKYAGVFCIIITLKSGSEESAVIDIVNHTISDLIENGIRKRELEKSINGYKSSFIYSLQNLDTFANQINSYNCSLGEPNSFIFDLNRYQKLKEKDIQNAASKYLKNYNVELLITPKIK